MSSPCRILYVDDDRDSCDLARVMLNYSDTGCAVTTSDSAEEALLLIDKHSFDIYVFDYWMPDISGIELCRYVRQSDSNTPIVFFSAMARPVDIAEGVKAGANEYLIKPNDLEKLPETVKRLLAENSAVRQAELAMKNRPVSISEKTALQTSYTGKSQPSVWKVNFKESTADSSKAPFRKMSKINNLIKEKKFNQTNKFSKAHFRPIFIGTAILAAIVLHFTIQSSFFQNEKISPNVAREQRVEPKLEYEAKNPDIKTMPDIVQPETKIAPLRKTTKNAPTQTVIKKTEPRESKAVRLRRAEKFLTGV